MTGTLITKFFAYNALYKKKVIHQGQLQKALNISLRQEQYLLSTLARKHSIIRLMKGIYLIPSTIPPGGKWQPSSLYVISYFMQSIDAEYYIGGLYAFHYWGFTEQMPNFFTIYNDKTSGKRKLGVLNLQLIKISKSRIGKNKAILLEDNRVSYIATLPRTLLDAVQDWKRFGTLPETFNWIVEKSNNHGFVKEFIKTTSQYGNASAKRRIGYYLFSLTNDSDLVKPILKRLKPTKSWQPLNPEARAKGRTHNKWRIIDNLDRR